MLKLPKKKEYVETTCFYTWLGPDGICRSKSKKGAKVHLGEAKENSEAVLSFSQGKKFPILVDVSKIRSIDKEARDFYSLQNRKSPVNAIAIIIGSPISKVIGNFFIGINKSRVPNKLFDSEKAAIKWLNKYVRKEKKQSTDERLKEILNVIISYAQLDFKNEVKTLGHEDEIDALGTGVNMLGEELNARVLSLKEKETMIKEVHHRIKNNLQIISSLLNLQVKNTSNEELRSYARESQSRIKTISLIHEMIYKSDDFGNINFEIYVTKIIEMLNNTFSLNEGNINYDISIKNDMYFGIDTLIPIGLIINEAITNSIKFAFPKGTGTISVKAKQKNKVCKVKIFDDGVGLLKDFNEEEDVGLGMHLIEVLAEQIDIDVKMKNKIGLGYQLTFAIP